MAKFRSKLTRHTKGKTWNKGQSSTSNPEQMKHRSKAKSRFFQPLSVAPDISTNPGNTLTIDAVLKHEQRAAYNAEATVNDVAGSLKSFNLNDEDDDQYSDSQQGTFSTMKTFASAYSSCSNMSFKKLMSGFRSSSELHKEMLAILTALTEIIKDHGGTESSTEYFILLIKQIEASTDDNDINAGISLLSMGIKSVPAAVLRKEFDTTATLLLNVLKRYMESSNQTTLKHVLGCLSVLLRAQDYVIWTYSSTWQYVDAILAFTIHNKPKLRRAAQHAIVSIIQASSFMTSKVETEESENTGKINHPKAVYHPASSRIAKFCLNQFKPELITNSQTTVLHILTLMKDIISKFKTEDIRTTCENLLSIMAAPNVIIRVNCFNVLHSLFITRTTNLDSTLCAKLLIALYEYMPDRTDVRQTIAWVAVLKEGHIHLAHLDLALCMNALPRFIDICAHELWISDHAEITAAAFNCIKELLLECVQQASTDRENADIYRTSISRIITSINKVMNAPFGDVAKYVILTFAILFEVCGEHFKSELSSPLLTLAKRYDTESVQRIQIEYAVTAAIKSMGPKMVLQTVPLTNSKNEVLLEKSWLLPLLREGIVGATFQYFKNNILPLAVDCNSKWHKYSEDQQIAMAHTYELLCCQLWSLFPGFCRKPKDPENLHLIAATLGNALDNNPEFHAPILDGFIELIQNNNDIVLDNALAKYSKNFLPRFFNVYTKKPSTSYEADLHKKTLEVIKLYLTKTPEDALKEMFSVACKQLSNAAVGSFEYDAIFDITAAVVLYQPSEHIHEFFESYVVPILKNEKSKLVSKDDQKLKKQQRKTYELLRDILTSERPSCKKFGRKNSIAIQKLLSESFTTSCAICQAARLKCLKILLENRKGLTISDKIVMKTIPEAVLSYKEFSTRKENIAEEIIKFIAELYKNANKLNDFIDILTAGFVGDESLITNTILALRTVVQYYGRSMTISTLEFILEQIVVFVVQKSRGETEASIAFLITFIKVLPSSLLANHLETIMKSLSAMVKDTKRYCRIQIGYLLKKLCKRFNIDELKKFVPGDDEVTHKRLKKIQKQIRRDLRKKINDEKDKDAENDSDEEEFNSYLKKKSETVEEILADSDSDLSMEESADEKGDKKSSSKKQQNTFIREDPEDIVDLADIKSIGSVLTNHPNLASSRTSNKLKSKDLNRGFKTSSDGRLIISEKALNAADSDENDDDNMLDQKSVPKKTKLGMEEDSSDEEEVRTTNLKRKHADASSVRSGQTATSSHFRGGKGIHRKLDSDAVSMKSSFSSKSTKSVKVLHSGVEYTAKKAKGDMKKKGQLDPYAYLTLSRNTLNKRKRAKNLETFKSITPRKGTLKSVKTRITKKYKK